MSKTEEFEAWMDSMKEDLTKKMYEEGLVFITADGKEFENSGVRCIKLLLQGCSNEQMKELGGSESIEIFDRLARNFIAANTLEDLNVFIKHNTAIKIMGFLSKMK